MEYLQGGDQSEAAGKICGITVSGTVGLAASGAVPLAAAFGIVSGGMCALSMWAARNEH